MQLQERGPCVVRQIRVLQHKLPCEVKLQQPCLDALCSAAADRNLCRWPSYWGDGRVGWIHTRHRTEVCWMGDRPVTRLSRASLELQGTASAQNALPHVARSCRISACHLTAKSTRAVE